MSYLFVGFAEDLSRGLGVKESDDDPGVLPLQVGDGRLRVPQEALAGRDVDPGKLGPSLEVVQRLEVRDRLSPKGGAMTFCQNNNSLKRQFAEVTICRSNNLPKQQFGETTNCQSNNPLMQTLA